jgi:TetR/AcrR family transcriptional regulator, mexJK operon transcriptional repressor
MPIAAAPEIRRGRKFGQVLDGARVIFMRDGYDGASVDDIARAAGVSKATLYAYFPDKRLLFLEVAQGECLRQADEAGAMIGESRSVEEALTFAARRITDFILSDFGLQMYRIAVAEGGRFPELGQAFYMSGPMAVRGVLGAYLRAAAARGELVVPDIDLAADQFCELCKADVLHRRLFGGEARIAAKDSERTIRGAVEVFLARYGAGR